MIKSSIIQSSINRFLGVGMGLFLTMVMVSPVLAQEESPLPDVQVPPEEIVSEVDVPDPDSVSDFFQRFSERMQLLTTREQAKKAELELKFNARREAQLAKCEKFTDQTKKDKCLTKVTERSDKLLERLQNRAENLREKRDQLKEKLEQARERRQEKIQQIKQRRVEIKQEFKDKKQELKEEIKDERMERKEKREERREEKKEDRQERKENRVERKEERLERIEESKSGDSSVDTTEVKGVSTRQPDIIDAVENALDSVFGW